MRRFITKTLSYAIACALTVTLFAPDCVAQNSSKITIGSALPQGKLSLLSGKKLDLASKTGKPFVAVILDPDSGVCHHLAPKLKSYFQKVKNKNFVFIFLRRRNAKKFQRQHNLPGNVAIAPDFAKRFKLTNTPYVAIFGSSGKLSAQSSGDSSNCVKFIQDKLRKIN